MTRMQIEITNYESEVKIMQEQQSTLKSMELVQSEDLMNKIKAKNTIMSNENLHLKQQNHEWQQRIKNIESQNEMYID